MKPPNIIYGLLDEDGVLWAGNGYHVTRKESIEFAKSVEHDLGKLKVVKYKLVSKLKRIKRK